MYEIKTMLINRNNPHIPFVAKGIVLHETATKNDTAEGERNYFNNNTVNASAHAFIDNKSIVQCIDWGHVAWHAGSTANKQFIGIELCHATNYANFMEIWNRGVWLFANLFVNKIGCRTITTDNLMSHAEVSMKWHETDHMDPIEYFQKYNKTVDNFRKDVQKMINDMTTPVTPKPITWQEILAKCTSEPTKWLNAIDVAVKAAKAEGDLGTLEIFQYFPELIVKIYNSK